MQREKILVLMGGISEEREVSLRSGKAVLDALQALNYEAQAIDFNSSSIKDTAKNSHVQGKDHIY